MVEPVREVAVGFSLRRSVSMGPFRFSLSGSGVGASIGVTGLRLGTGPRGAYVSVGAGGVSYRQTLGSRAKPTLRSGPEPDAAVHPVEITSGDVAQMVDATSEDLVRQLNSGLGVSDAATPVLVLAGLVALGAAPTVWLLGAGGHIPAAHVPLVYAVAAALVVVWVLADGRSARRCSPSSRTTRGFGGESSR